MGISARLRTIAELVTPGFRAADIGTDHGYVPIYLLRKEISPFVIAADLSPGSLEKARENAERAGFLIEDRKDTETKICENGIVCRLSDGLSEFIPGEVDSIILSGMGGILMNRILRDGADVVQSAKELILSPHRDVDLIRAYAEENGFEILEDLKLLDKKKQYAILKIRVN
ncbi:MAG: SAM-dependent methyltransferase [Parasporobacterium sp.]|nr:SAM-dependent methyltransferase [Parasporobacterium sp.]